MARWKAWLCRLGRPGCAARGNLLATTRLVRYRGAPGEGSFHMKSIGPATAACLVAAPAWAQQLAPSPTLDAIKARGHIECGVHLGLPGFSFANDKGEWSGLDVDYCKSLAAAVLGDATKVKFTPTSVQQRWAVLQSGQVDLLSRNTTITFSRNATLGVNFQGINFYEGQTFVVRTKAKVAAVKDLADATICVAAGSAAVFSSVEPSRPTTR